MHQGHRIVIDPEILGGKPVIKGTRLSVEFILELLASGITQTEILEDYPHISEEDLHAVLEYAARSIKNDIYIPLADISLEALAEIIKKLNKKDLEDLSLLLGDAGKELLKRKREIENKTVKTLSREEAFDA